ncbi:MAG: type II toxin-antitoxin system HicB family antitoxin [Bryobacteraceae bacterium]|nr:type II toxin-antitoxin system HicB family antitoxin [Bryobacteraceae bacterium]
MFFGFAAAELAPFPGKLATAVLGTDLGHGRKEVTYYPERMLRYHVAFHLPHTPGEMVVAEALDFPGAVTQGFDLPDARLMIASAIEDMAQLLLEEGKPLPVPLEMAQNPDADLIELVPLSVHAGNAGT